jgi:hypothetical protein
MKVYVFLILVGFFCFQPEKSLAASCKTYTTHCGMKCGKDWGVFCFWGTVCNPVTHSCEKTLPIYGGDSSASSKPLSSAKK